MLSHNDQYVSEDLFHFVGRHLPSPDAQYDLLATILEQALLKATRGPKQETRRSGTASLYSGELERVPALCFCDIPRHMLRRHTEVYGEFGLAFPKWYLADEGAKPVIYVPSRSRPSTGQGERGTAFPANMRRLIGNLGDRDEQFVTSEISYFVKVFDDDLEQDHPKNYYMER